MITKIITNEKNLKIEDIKFWCHDPDQEVFYSQTIQEAVEEWIVTEAIGEIVEVVTNKKSLILHGYVEKLIDKVSFKEAVLEFVEEYINENYMGEDGHESCEDQKSLIGNFCEEYAKGVTTWQCDEAMTIEVSPEHYKAKEEASEV